MSDRSLNQTVRGDRNIFTGAGDVHVTYTEKDRRPPLTRQQLRNRRALLAEVKSEVAGRLAQSVHHAVLIHLLKETHPDEVERLWDVEVKVGTQQGIPLAPETELIDVFDEEAVAGKLLILGAPGAGKTTTLLQLAKELVARAENDGSEAIPVLVNLSSWRDDNQPIASWLVAELHLKYGIRTDIGQRWLDERDLLPLLDGLDELEPARQERCIQAINRFHRECGPEHLVVCCRLAEYRNSTTKLQLNGAVQLQPLTEEQVHSYLLGGGRPELWQSVQADPELMTLAKSPLFLSIMTLAYEEGAIQNWQKPDSTHKYRQFLFDMFVERMLSRNVIVQRYSKEKTLKWLAWLAKRLQEGSQPEFLIEKLQPFWLQNSIQKFMYHIGIIMVIVLIVMMIWYLTLWLREFLPKSELERRSEDFFRLLFEESAWQYIDQYTDLMLPMIMSLIVGLIVSLRRTIIPIETLKWSGARAWNGMRLGLRRWAMRGLEFGVYAGLMAGLIVVAFDPLLPMGLMSSSELAIWGKTGQIAGRIVGLVAGVTAVLAVRPSVWLQAEVRERLSSRLPRAVMSGLLCGLGVGIGIGYGGGLLVGLGVGLGIGILVGLSYGLSDRRAFRWADALIVGLLGGLGVGMVSWLVGGLLLNVWALKLASWLHIWLLSGLGVGATVGLIAGLLTMLREKTKPVQSLQASRGEQWNWPLLSWPTGPIVAAVALIWGVMVSVLTGWGQIQIFQASSLLAGMWGLLLITAFGKVLIFTPVGAVCGLGNGALGGALIGALGGGLTGPEIERRAAPNQGIRQSAVNVGIFALIGGLVLGPIFWLVAVASNAPMFGLAPTAGLPWRDVLWNMLFFGLFSGLVPGAACLQHFTLRFVLWGYGLAPWHYARFLDYATERMFLQRVGGRYRFLHDLLRDHFAAMASKEVNAAESNRNSLLQDGACRDLSGMG